MPTYDFYCKVCDSNSKIFTTMKSLKEGYNCEHCNAKLVRIFAVSAVTFKGDGFASNDKK
jgi:putative FmdB family regulatory protein